MATKYICQTIFEFLAVGGVVYLILIEDKVIVFEEKVKAYIQAKIKSFKER